MYSIDPGEEEFAQSLALPILRSEDKTKEEDIITSLLGSVGVAVNGHGASALHVHDDRFYRRVLGEGSLGLGESYMEGWWDCDRLDQLFYRILAGNVDGEMRKNWSIASRIAWNVFLHTAVNFGKKKNAFAVGETHYDIGNDLYQAMLDERLAYTCGYWKDAYTLGEAQIAKLDLVCQKLGLKPGDRVLDIGSGWGSFIGYAAERYGVTAVGVTVSREQKAFADKQYKDLPVETRLQDYRDISGKFDYVVSLGMFEHVGFQNYQTFMRVVHDALRNDGLFLLHTIGGNYSVRHTDPWIEKYIFPNSMIPSAAQINKASEGLFVLEDWHNFGADYDRTLLAWEENIEKNWKRLAGSYDEGFHRMWRYYLLSCAGSFRARRNQLWQIVFAKGGVRGGYRSVR